MGSAQGGPRRWALAACLAIAGSVQAAPTAIADAQPYSEDAVKAVFLYRFTSFVDWPSDAAAPPQFEFAVLNADGVADALGRLLPDRQIQDRPARVRRIARIRDLGAARVLYVGSDPPAELAPIVAAIANQPVLVVTSMQRGLEQGSTINFIVVDRRVRFEVSLRAANRAQLKISSELLSVASRVLAGENLDERSDETRLAQSKGSDP